MKQSITEAAFITDRARGRDTIRVYGEVDQSNCEDLSRALRRLRNANDVRVVDLNQCVYMDLAALRVLARAKRELRKQLRIVAPPGSSIGRMIEISGLSELLNPCAK